MSDEPWKFFGYTGDILLVYQRTEYPKFHPEPPSGNSFKTSGPRLNIKTVLSTYGDFHVEDKTAVRMSYL